MTCGLSLLGAVLAGQLRVGPGTGIACKGAQVLRCASLGPETGAHGPLAAAPLPTPSPPPQGGRMDLEMTPRTKNKDPHPEALGSVSVEHSNSLR